MTWSIIARDGPTQAIFQHPQAAYTRALLDAIPGRSLFAGPGSVRPVDIVPA